MLSIRPRRAAAGLLLLVAIAAALPAVAQEYELTPPDPPPFLHHWRATLGYNGGGAPLYNASDARIGYSHSDQVLAGLEAGIGDRGFGRLEAGRAWREGKRRFEFDALRSKSDADIVGVSGGVFLTPFLSAGLSLQHRREDGTETFTNLAGGQPDNHTRRNSRSNRVAPFLLLAGPVGAFDLGLLAAYARVNSKSEYRPIELANSDSADSGRVHSRLLDFSAGYWLTPDLKLGGSLGWTQVLAQRVQSTSLGLDRDWGTVGAHATYKLRGDLDVTLRGDRDIENALGNGFRFGAGLAYRF